jgi:hypothetical protein
VRLGDGRSRVSLTFCTPRILRVELLGSAPDPGPSFVVPRDWPATPIEVHDGEPARLGTSDLGVEVTTSPVRLTFLDAAGNWLLHEPADGGMAREQGATGGARVHARFAFSGEQHFYGLGQGGGPLDRLGTYRQLWNTHLGHGPGSDRRCRSSCRIAAAVPSTPERAARRPLDRKVRITRGRTTAPLLPHRP